MNWKPIFAMLLLFTTVSTYFVAKGIANQQEAAQISDETKRTGKGLLLFGIVSNLAILFVFKYYNFVNESVFTLLDSVGIRWGLPNLDLLLPVGISFYTFIALGYIIDVYQGKWKAENDFIKHALFVGFFPQLLSGPIARAKDLLPQFNKEHKLEYVHVSEGVKLMLWGYFMKLCIADVICEYVNATFDNIAQHSGPSLLLGAVLFTIQIYCDFAGYSNIAIGTAKVMGFNLMENFKRPYLSLSMKEFWKRWHISLSSWFMDYVYIPLGGNRCKYGRHLFNLMVTFVVSGIWHGANWTFILWGGYHGLLLCLENVRIKMFGKPKSENRLWYRMVAIPFCFLFATIGWVFFRSNSIADAFTIIAKIYTNHDALYVSKLVFLQGTIGVIALVIKDLKDEYGWKLNFMHSNYIAVRYLSAILLIAYIITFGALNGGSFIYFQF